LASKRIMGGVMKTGFWLVFRIISGFRGIFHFDE
jgi:hypothetical protein